MRLNIDSRRKQKGLCFLVSAVGTAIGFLAFCTGGNPAEIASLQKENKEQNIQLFVQQPGDEMVPITVKMQRREHTEEEENEILVLAYKEILEDLRGENVSLQKIETDLHFSYTWEVEGIKMNVVWSIPKELPIHRSGAVKRGQEAVSGELGLELISKEFSGSWSVPVTVLPESLDAISLEEYVQDYVESQDGQEVILPDTFHGKPLVYYSQKKESVFGYIIPGMLFGIVLWFYLEETKKKQIQKRKKELEEAYPEFALKIALFYAAGLSMRTIWNRMLEDGESEGYLKEELRRMNLRMKNGMPEALAYWSFGEACELQSYRRLVGIIEQTVVKGSRGLSQLLDDAARDSVSERRALIKRKGEEINTKLLLPMMLLFGVVIMLVMVPALLQVRIGL